MKRLPAHIFLAFNVFSLIGHAQESPRQVSERAKKTEADEVDWVKEIEPGIRLYGRVPPFGEVGQSRTFDVSPDAQTIAFAAETEILFWNIEEKKSNTESN